MKNFTELAEFYSKRFAWKKERWIENKPSSDLRLGIIIPAFDEELDVTLQSLGECKLEYPRQCELILVLNHSQNADEHIKLKHQEQFKTWRRAVLANGLKVNLINAFDLAHKRAGVGLARKIGMDEMLQRFASVNHDGLIVCLDADCTVSENYLQSLLYAERKKVNGLSIYYEHPVRNIKDPSERENIINYEIFLRYYSRALTFTGYPFSFQTVGSSMAARASVYARIGGMNQRKAGEDFYFLHKVFPQGNFMEWPYCTVYPSARRSERVPFGTGKAMIASANGDKDYRGLYHPKIFTVLKKWMEHVSNFSQADGAELSIPIQEFLKAEKLYNEYLDLQKRSTNHKQFIRNFFFWLDGFKILRLIHFLQQQYSDIPNTEACAQLLNTQSETTLELLLELRRLEKIKPLSYL